MEFQKIEWTDDVIEEFWRYWSERPETYFTETLGETIVQFTIKNNVEIGMALDFGAGSGGLLAALSRKGFCCSGLEFGEAAISKLKARFAADDRVENILGTEDVPSYHSYFDTIFLIETIEHLPDRHLIPTAEHIVSMLKPGGWLVVSTPNDEDLKKSEVYCPVSKVAFHPMQHLRSWNRKSLSKFLVDVSLSQARCFEADLQALPYHSKSEFTKRMMKRFLYQNYKDPHLVAFARKTV